MIPFITASIARRRRDASSIFCNDVKGKGADGKWNVCLNVPRGMYVIRNIVIIENNLSFGMLYS